MGLLRIRDSLRQEVYIHTVAKVTVLQQLLVLKGQIITEFKDLVLRVLSGTDGNQQLLFRTRQRYSMLTE